MLSLSKHSLVSPTLALVVTLLGCSAEPRSPPVGAGVHSSAQAVEQCSIFAAMACSAVTLLSGKGVAGSTCDAYRASDGTRVETCGSQPTVPTTTSQAPSRDKTHSVRLSWSDNSNNENGFVIERCDQVKRGDGGIQAISCVGEWKRVGVVAANITSYVDHTALLNQTYLYRVKATNNTGNSNSTSEVPVTTPPH